ncbi:MAG: tyrosine recombinase XerC [Clostridia bacterium]|nr:tyrosine recombinase XerC [Clostridia bacterium]
MPQTIKDFIFYLEVVLGKSKSTTYEYILDLANFFRYMKILKCDLPKGTKLHDVTIHDIDVAFVAQITLADIYEYFYYCREKRGNGSKSIARKMSSLRMYFKYMTQRMHLLSSNPMENVETPSLPKTLPKYLTLEESTELLRAVKSSRRDYAILTVFLNCGLRLAELVSLDLKDIKNEYVVVTGKGNKQRTIHLNPACRDAIDDYIAHERPTEGLKDPEALFISRNKCRISRRAVQNIVDKYLKLAGLDERNLSTHKLRHTAATLMHRHGHVDIRVLQEILGHENLGTTQIYTHVDSETIKEASMSNPLSKVRRKNSDE